MTAIDKVYYEDVLEDDILNLLKPYIQGKEKELYITSDNFAIDLNKVTALLDLKIQYEDLDDDVSGYIDERTIYVNKNHSSNRKRFTIAHEIGHFLHNHKNKIKYRNNSYAYDTEEMIEERVANDFSANLLMPKKQMEALVYKFYKENNINLTSGLSISEREELINYIEIKLEVSKIAAGIRLYNLGLDK
ncbi:ImmA/IrrE family metallo-endopeptidase [Staphylococcus aureus]